MFQPNDCVPFEMLREIGAGLAAAAWNLQDALVARVRATSPEGADG